MLTELYGRKLIPGRDSFFTLLRRHQLMLPPRKARHTTNSNHRYHKWKNLVKGIVLTSANQLWVSDITLSNWQMEMLRTSIWLRMHILVKL